MVKPRAEVTVQPRATINQPMVVFRFFRDYLPPRLQYPLPRLHYPLQIRR